MTPDLIAYYNLGDGVYVDLSKGEGIIHGTLYGVTVRPDPDHKLSKCFFDFGDAMDYIYHLDKTKPWKEGGAQ